MPDAVSLVLFILVVIAIIASEIALKERLEKRCFSWYPAFLSLDFATVAVLGVALFVATLQISWSTVKAGIVGDEHIKPYAVVLLFLSLAYVSISVDETGLFEFCAIHVVRMSRGNGIRLFISIFLFAAVVAILTSNDVVIFTLTPIIVSVASIANTPPEPFLFAQFAAANICSITLLTGNPANIIAGETFNLTYLTYLKWTIVPSVCCAATALGLLLFVFRNDIPQSLFIPEIDEWSRIKSLRNAKASAALLAVTIILLATANFFGAPLYVITLAAAGLMLCKDLVLDFLDYRQSQSTATPAPTTNASYQQAELLHNAADSAADQESVNPTAAKHGNAAERRSMFAETSRVLGRLPWRVPPFLFSMFILVHCLQEHGWTDQLARLFSIAEHSAVAAACLMGLVSFLVANLMNNLPTTVLFSRVATSADFIANENVKFAALLGLILGTNFCAVFTVIGAMAGIVWSKLLKNRGVTISYLRFFSVGVRVAPVVLTVGCLIVALEVDLFK